jgi:antitoxin PrlF
MEGAAHMLYSTVTARAQTTLPNGVRKALGIGPGDKLVYQIQGDHAVIRRVAADDPDGDPVIGAYLAFLEREMIAHPERVQPASAEWVARMRNLAEGISVDFDEEIEGPVPL